MVLCLIIWLVIDVFCFGLMEPLLSLVNNRHVSFIITQCTFFYLPECTADQVQQQPGGVIATEGGLVTLS
jgi:hypothetical protein